VWLTPAPTSAAIRCVAVAAATAIAAGTGALLWAGGHELAPTAVVVACAALTAGVTAGALAGHGRGRTALRARQTAMAIVPWGVIVDPDAETRVLRWPGVRRVSVHVKHAMRGGTPIAIDSVVAVDTGREVLSGRAVGAVGLEQLTVHLHAYADEAARPVALDLEGTEEAGDGATEPVIAQVLARAGDLCTSGSGAAQLGLPHGGYRSMAARAAGPDTLALLRSILEANPGRADVRPLASVLAVLLGARALVPQLLRLVSVPHPVVAAVARAAACRLGAPQSRAGAIDEVAAFLFDEDRERLERWALDLSRLSPVSRGASTIA
jgi:hypothetical protein